MQWLCTANCFVFRQLSSSSSTISHITNWNKIFASKKTILDTYLVGYINIKLSFISRIYKVNLCKDYPFPPHNITFVIIKTFFSDVVLKHTISKRNKLLSWHKNLTRITSLITNVRNFDRNMISQSFYFLHFSFI